MESSCAKEKSTSTAPPVPIVNKPLSEMSQKPYKFSTEAEPFIPSFMSSAGTPANSNTPPVPMVSECVGSCATTLPLHSYKDSVPQTSSEANSGSKRKKKKTNASKQPGRWHCNTDRSRKANFDLWASQLVNMSENEVLMLMDCLPEDVQNLYYHHLTHHTNTNQQGNVSSFSRDQQPTTSQSPALLPPAVSAAFSTFNEISEEQLQYIEQLLCLESLNNYGADDEMQGESLFVNQDEGLNSEEEEWLLEQIMSVDPTPVEPEKDQNEREQHALPKHISGRSEGNNKGRHAKRRGGH